MRHHTLAANTSRPTQFSCVRRPLACVYGIWLLFIGWLIRIPSLSDPMFAALSGISTCRPSHSPACKGSERHWRFDKTYYGSIHALRNAGQRPTHSGIRYGAESVINSQVSDARYTPSHWVCRVTTTRQPAYPRRSAAASNTPTTTNQTIHTQSG